MTPKSNWQDAHIRMLQALPKRTHFRQRLEWEDLPRGGRERVAVRIAGVIYPSMTHAAKALNASRVRIKGMLKRGEAFIE